MERGGRLGGERGGTTATALFRAIKYSRKSNPFLFSSFEHANLFVFFSILVGVEGGVLFDYLFVLGSPNVFLARVGVLLFVCTRILNAQL